MSNPAQLPSPRERAFDGLLGAYRADLGEMGTRAYVKALADIPDAKLFAGIKRAMQNCPTFPSAATLREQCVLATPVEVTTKYLPAPVDDARDFDPRSLYHCGSCQDSGWIVRDGPHPLQPGVVIPFAHRCACAMTNPAVRAGVGVGAR